MVPKRKLFDEVARVGRALASGRRLELLEFLAQRERSVHELARLLGASVANTSQHLQVLRETGLVEARKDGLRVHYRLAGPEVFALFRALRETAAARVAQVERLAREFRREQGSLEEVTLAELQRRMKVGEVILVDVRPADEFEAGHIPGARSIPLAELRQQWRALPRDREIVAYCRGPYCFLSDEAVRLLRGRGRRAVRLAVGYPDWRAA